MQALGRSGATLLRPAAMGGRPLHASAPAFGRTPMIQFKYGNNKGGAAPAAAADKAPKPAKAPAAPKATAQKITWSDQPVSPAMVAFAAEAVASKVANPACYMDRSVDVTHTLALLGKKQQTSPGLSLTDVVLKSAGSALAKLPAANAVYVGEGVTQELGVVNVAVAVRGDSGVR